MLSESPAPSVSSCKSSAAVSSLLFLRRLSLEVPSQTPELAAFLGLVRPALREVTLVTWRGLTNAELQQLCQQMPRLKTLDIRIRKRRSQQGHDPTMERRAVHTVCRANSEAQQLAGPWLPLGGRLNGIKRYLKLWTEVKRFSISCVESEGGPQGPPRGPRHEGRGVSVASSLRAAIFFREQLYTAS